MIGTIDIKINAAKPNFPLSPFYAFINSPSQVRVVNVPRSIGDWEITKVYVTANYPDNTSRSVECTLTGGCWHGTLVASTSTGTSTNGFTITADGVKEDGTTAVTGYVLGKGDLAILDTDGQITVGETTFYIHLLDSQPTTAHKGDVCLIDNAWKIYNGTAWIGFGSSIGDICHSDFTAVNALADRYTLADVKGKVNEVLNILKGSTTALAALILALVSPTFALADIAVQWAQLDSLYNDSLVVTNVTGNSDGVSTNGINALIRSYDSTNLTSRIDAKQNAIEDYTTTNAVCAIVTNNVVVGGVTNNALGFAYWVDTTNAIATATPDLSSRTTFAQATNIAASAAVTNAGAVAAAASAASDKYLPLAGGAVPMTFAITNKNTGSILKFTSVIGGYAGWSFYGKADSSESLQVGMSKYVSPSSDKKTIVFGTPSSLSAQINSILQPDGSAVATMNSVKDATNATLTAANAYADAKDEATKQIVYTWEQFLDGSNVVFSITNYISGSYRLDDAKLRIMEMTNGVYREVYNSRDEIDLHVNYFKTNEFATATNQVITTVNTAIAGKADKAWGKYTSMGGEPATSNTVYIIEPQTYFAGGYDYHRIAVGQGAICVLADKGAPTYIAGDEGTFKFQDDGGTNYFGFAKSDSYVIGADANAISVSSGLVTIEYNLTMTGYPCLWYKANLDSTNEWEKLNLPNGDPIAGASHVVSWETEVGKKVVEVNCTNEAKGFFKATIETGGEAKFFTNMPAEFSSGILCTNGTDAVVAIRNGSSIYWQTTDGTATSGGGASLAGYTADFNYGTNFTLRLYQSLTNVIIRLGGSVTNAPAFN